MIYNYIIKDNFDSNITKKERNIGSFTHATVIVVSYLFNPFVDYDLPLQIMYLSISFYIIDMAVEFEIYLASTEENKKVNYSTFVHHISTIISLFYIQEHRFVYVLLFLMEMSNIPMYIIYNNNICSNKIVSKYDIQFEIFFYVIFRIVFGSIIVYQNFNQLDLVFKSIVFIIGTMSIYWTNKLFNQLKTFT